MAVLTVLLMSGVGVLIAMDITAMRIQQDIVPSIVAMEHVQAWLVDADRSAASVFLAADFDSPSSESWFDPNSPLVDVDVLGRISRDDPQRRFQADVGAATSQLYRTYHEQLGNANSISRLQTVWHAITTYTSLVRLATGQERTDVALGTSTLWKATNLMHGPTGILSQVDSLLRMFIDDLNGAVFVLELASCVLPAYAVAIFALLVLYVIASRFSRDSSRGRTRRLVATGLVLVVFVGGVAAAAAADSVSGSDYGSMVRVWATRSLLYDANSNETLALISWTRRAPFDQAFERDLALLVDRPLTTEMVRHAERGDVEFNGLIADNLRAARTGPDHETAIQMLRTYRQYLSEDAATRAHAEMQTRAIQEAAAHRPRWQPYIPEPPLSDEKVVSAADEMDWYLGVSIQQRERRFATTMNWSEQVLGLAILDVLIVGLACAWLYISGCGFLYSLARLLPTAERERFIGETQGNLGACEHWWQRLDQMAALTLGMPRLAYMMHREHRRDRVR